MDTDLAETKGAFSSRFTQVVEDSHLSISALARESLVSRWTIMNWMRGLTSPEMAGLRRVAQVLGVRPEDLLGQDHGEDVVDTVDKYFSWLGQQHYRQVVLLRRVIDSEVERRVAEGLVQRGRPPKELTERVAANVVAELTDTDKSPTGQESPKRRRGH
ncbi:MAG: helix-turn-helix transcriptional regulator [Chloroflexota bacterium]|nr:helix-turn-helix transcriptional regulator [Chloroflexota bacterium]